MVLRDRSCRHVGNDRRRRRLIGGQTGIGAVTDPALRERLEGTDSYGDARVENDFHAEVILHEDFDRNGESRVEYQDDDGGCYITIFAGPKAEQRARGASRPFGRARRSIDGHEP
jgi:hypothetical protein